MGSLQPLKLQCLQRTDEVAKGADVRWSFLCLYPLEFFFRAAALGLQPRKVSSINDARVK